MTDFAPPPASNTPRRRSRDWIVDLLLIYILLMAAYLRFSGLNWGEYSYMHPDERFMIWVGTDISPVKSLSEYWDTANSSLNPHNRGHSFYVYGTLPLYMARYLVEFWKGHSGFNEMTDMGRALSATLDLLTVFFVFLTGKRAYNPRVGLLAAAFTALAVLQIQQAHFFTVDSSATFFGIATIYFAVRVATIKSWPGEGQDDQQMEGAAPFHWYDRQSLLQLLKHPLLLDSLAFGLFLGFAASSKIDAVALAILLPAALFVCLSRMPALLQSSRLWQAGIYLVLAAFVSFWVFRICMPMAFSGPGFFGLKPNPAWIANLRELANQGSGDVDMPPMMQWARRPITFAWQNMVQFGMGLPLGLLALAGFFGAGWRMLRGEWRPHLVIWLWTGFFSLWRGLVVNASMRYQLLVYPTLAIFAAWAIVALWDKAQEMKGKGLDGAARWGKFGVVVMGMVALVGSGLYAWMFVDGVYHRTFTRVEASRWMFQNLPGPINLRIQSGEALYSQPVSVPYDYLVRPGMPFTTVVRANTAGTLSEVYLPHVLDAENTGISSTLTLKVLRSGQDAPAASASLTSVFVAGKEGMGKGYVFQLDTPLLVEKDEQFTLWISLESGAGAVAMTGTALANEGDWDDGLPVRLDGYDAYGGIFVPGLNFNMYWDDNADKLARFNTILGQAEYIAISSNRQWGSLPRIPERFPMTTVYYRHLLGCPEDKDIVWCYSVAQVGTFQGDLGFELVQVFQHNPRLGPFEVNTQFAEEAFTVYDHPKVFVFRKQADYDPQKVASILGSVDLNKVIRIPPGRFNSFPMTLELPPDRWEGQTSGGTWAELFNPQSPLNRWPALGAVVWYLSVFALGLVVFPIVRFGLPGLADGGYPLARTAGLLLLSYLVWLAGSLEVPFTRPTITAALLLLLVVGGLLAYRQREGLRQEWKHRWRYFLAVEALFLAFFVFLLLVRLGNPDLWHPFKGGEKPMDFSYFNAVLRSTTFPPYDPWYAGGYLNYYYYGFVFIGVLVKWLGITPAVAYNLALPTIFSLLAMGAFSLGWNLFGKHTPHKDQPVLDEATSDFQTPLTAHPSSFSGLNHYLIGIAAALGMAVLGNLGTVRMIFQGYQRLAAPGGAIEGAGMLQRWVWALQGLGQVLTGAGLPYGLGDWYWIPSRAIPAPNDVEPITEFPYFTVLYADLHAHLFSMAITLLALAFALSAVTSLGWLRPRRLASGEGDERPGGWLAVITGLVLGGLAISALKPTNTWDLYTYLALGLVALAYGLWFGLGELPRGSLPLMNRLPAGSQAVLAALVGAGAVFGLGSLGLRLLESSPLTGLLVKFLLVGAAAMVALLLWQYFSARPENTRLAASFLLVALGVGGLAVLTLTLFQPFDQWFGQGYSKLTIWKGTHTPLGSYIVHWGLFLFPIISWMAWETRQWMAQTPVSALRKLQPYRIAIYATLALLGAIMILFQVWVSTLPEHGLKAPGVLWLALPLAAWAGVLILRPGMPADRRLVLFMIGTGLVLTMMVEVIVLVGDIGRMNTVFKFYLQVWTLFAVSAAASLGWLLPEMRLWYPRFRAVWSVLLVVLAGCAALFTLTATMAKIKDRMVVEAPHTLDGMLFMNYARYDWKGDMDLSQDYRAILWMQENVAGSPVIVEANLRDLYRWGSRFSIYTGLPGVVGWEWHQQQQRALNPGDWVSNRIREIEMFYTGTDLGYARDFLSKYNVRYVIVGQLERNVYGPAGLEKFPAADGVLWRQVYHEMDTTIYEVVSP